MGFKVEAGLFSGRTNPAITVTPEEATEIQRRVALLSSPGRRPFSRLGYYGMYVSNPTGSGFSASWGTVHAFEGMVEVWGEYAQQPTVFADTVELETYLRECFVRHAAEEDKAAFEGMLSYYNGESR
jgi:hypothetical protein